MARAHNAASLHARLSKLHTRPGFSLIEIVIAIVIIGMILAGSFYFIGTALERGRRSTTETKIRQIQTALISYSSDTGGSHPASLNDLIKKPQDVAQWKGPYLPSKQVPTDAWGSKFIYKQTPGQKNPFELTSYGSSAGKATPKDKWISVWDL